MKVYILEAIYTNSPYQTVFACTDEEVFNDTLTKLEVLLTLRPENWLASMCQVADHYFHADIIEFRTVSTKRLSSQLNISPRELEVAKAMTLGATPAEIAEALSLSVKTVATYRARLLDKLGVRTSAEIALKIREHGLA